MCEGVSVEMKSGGARGSEVMQRLVDHRIDCGFSSEFDGGLWRLLNRGQHDSTAGPEGSEWGTSQTKMQLVCAEDDGRFSLLEVLK